MANQSKISLVETISLLLEQSSDFVLVQFDKTTHKAMEALRKDLRKSDANMKVIKNTLFEKAIGQMAKKNKAYEEFQKTYFPIKETTALITLSKDWGTGVKVFHEFSKKDPTLSFKVAILDNKIYSKDEVTQIATLPSKSELMAKLIGQMKTPMAKLVYSMKFNMQKFTYILSQKSQKN